MTKIDSLRRILLPCFPISTPPPTTSSSTKKRLSASLRDDILTNDDNNNNNPKPRTRDLEDHPAASSSSSFSSPSSTESRFSHHRSSKSMVTCTFFGKRHSHVFFCVQLDPQRRRSTTTNNKPSLLLELSLSTHSLVKEMRSGLLRVALECTRADLGLGSTHCPLHSVPLWTLSCNGKRVGSAARRRPGEEVRAMLKAMENTTVGAGVIGDVMYMRANYEWVVGGDDSESFHLVTPGDYCPGQELSVFLLRSG